MRIANVNTIRSIDFSRSGIAGTGSLSPRARRVLQVYVVLVKMGYEGLLAPSGAISDAVYRSSSGEAGSVRTLQRAHPELIDKGYVSIRVDRRRKGLDIKFNLESFAFWTKKSSKSVTPLPTQYHNVVSRETMCESHLHTTSCRTSDRTKTKYTEHSEISQSSNKQPRAGARSINNRSKRTRKNAVWVTVNVLLGSMQDLHTADRKRARARAKCEIESLAGGVSLANPSGVDWQYWERRFLDMSIPVREMTAKREILPLLLGKKRRIEVSEKPTEIVVDTPTTEQIKKIRMELEQKMTIPDRSESIPVDQKISMKNRDLEILLRARDVTRDVTRCVNGR